MLSEKVPDVPLRASLIFKDLFFKMLTKLSVRYELMEESFRID